MPTEDDFYDKRRAYTVKAAQQLLMLSRSTIYKLIKSRTLSSVKVGGRRLIPHDALEALIRPT
jgi:excisionase family DNA binding protein